MNCEKLNDVRKLDKNQRSHDWSYQSAVFAQGVKIFNLELYISNEGDMLTVN